MNITESVIDSVATIVQFTRIDYAIIGLLVICSLAIGSYTAVYGGRTTDDFLFGGYKMGSVPIALSLLARWFFNAFVINSRQFNANVHNFEQRYYQPCECDFRFSQLSPLVILTMPVEIYSFGWQHTIFIPVLVLVMLALCYIFLPILYQNKLDNCYTVTVYLDIDLFRPIVNSSISFQYLEVRFRPLARNINIVVFTINTFLYLPVILYIPSLALAERKIYINRFHSG